MSCVLFTNNTTGAAIEADAQIPFGTIVHRKGRGAVLENNVIIVRGGCNDYSTMSGVANLVAAAAGDIAITVSVDGVNALTVTTTAVAEGDYVAIPFDLVLKGNCCGPHRITVSVNAACNVSSFPVKTITGV